MKSIHGVELTLVTDLTTRTAIGYDCFSLLASLCLSGQQANGCVATYLPSYGRTYGSTYIDIAISHRATLTPVLVYIVMGMRQ